MKNDKVGILSYGAYVPPLRVDIETFAEQWGLSRELTRFYKLNGRNQVAVNDRDEDTVTLAVEAAERAMLFAPPASRPGCLLVGSESHPYAVKPSGVIVAEALGLNPRNFTVDLEFACKAGTAALYLTLALVRSGQIEQGLAIGADCPQSAPGSILEASIGCGASAFLVGRGPKVAVAVQEMASASSDLSDFWRRDGCQFPSVVGKFSAQQGYEYHTVAVVEHLLAKSGLKPADIAYLCFHQPYQSLPLATARKLGFRRAQIQPGLTAAKIGNTYSSCSLLALCVVLEQARPGDIILLVSFGSGAGSDGFVLRVEDAIEPLRKKMARQQGLFARSATQQLDPANGRVLTYGQYVHNQNKLKA